MGNLLFDCNIYSKLVKSAQRLQLSVTIRKRGKNRVVRKLLCDRPSAEHSTAMSQPVHYQSRYCIKGSSVLETRFENLVNCDPAFQPLTEGVHCYRQLCTSLSTLLMLGSKAEVAPPELLPVMTVSAQIGCTNLHLLQRFAAGSQTRSRWQSCRLGHEHDLALLQQFRLLNL